MAKKKEETTVKDTKKATTKTSTTKATTTKTTTKATTKKTTADAKATKITKIGVEEKTTVAPEEKLTAEKKLALSCQDMMSSIIEWTMDSLMYSNIMLISKKMNISMEEAAAVLDVSVIELEKLSIVYAACSKTPEPDKTAVLGKYSDRIKTVESEKKASRGKKSAGKK